MATQTITPGEHYTTLFGHALAALPGARAPKTKERREASFARFQALGFPGPKTEAWKYTSVGPLAKLPYDLAPQVELGRADIAPFLIDDRQAVRLVFVNGHFAPALSDTPATNGKVRIASLAAVLDDGEAEPWLEAETERGFSALNAAFTGGGSLIELADGASLDGPLQLLFVSSGQEKPTLINPYNQITLGDGARLDLIESHVGLGTGQHLTNLVNRIVLGKGAELRHERLQLGALSGSLIGKNDYRLAADARLTQTLATLGGALVRNEIEARLEGSGIDATLNGLYLTRERQHIDNAIRVDHAAPGSVSNQFYKGILDGSARGVFAGKIIVRRPAQKTNAYQTNNNLMLSPDAEIDTKPELEIFADDVKCSHGATAGELDERELFYLRSRGLDPATARSLLTFAFAGEVLERFVHPKVAAHAKSELLRWLPGGDSLGELA